MDYRKALLKAASLVALTAAGQTSANAVVSPDNATVMPKSAISAGMAQSGIAAAMAKAAIAAGEQQLDQEQESFKLAQERRRRRPRDPDEVGQVPGGAPGGGRAS